jgi:hypothetical protein
MSIFPVRASDRRGSPRVTYPFDGMCSSHSGHGAVRICDLSATGCFIESLEAMTPGERVQIRIDVPGSQPIHVDGVVVYATSPMGFGVRFSELSNDRRERLLGVIAAFRSGERA